MWFFVFCFLSIDKSSTGLPAVATEHIKCVEDTGQLDSPFLPQAPSLIA